MSDTADTVNQLAQVVCANHGAYIHSAIEYVSGTIAVAALVRNGRAWLSKYVPAPVLRVLDAVALKFAKEAMAHATTPTP